MPVITATEPNLRRALRSGHSLLRMENVFVTLDCVRNRRHCPPGWLTDSTFRGSAARAFPRAGHSQERPDAHEHADGQNDQETQNLGESFTTKGATKQSGAGEEA